MASDHTHAVLGNVARDVSLELEVLEQQFRDFQEPRSLAAITYRSPLGGRDDVWNRGNCTLLIDMFHCYSERDFNSCYF